MKKNKNIFMASVLLLSLGLASCTDSFLDVTSKTESSTGTFYKTEKDAYRALIGCYDGWRQTLRGEKRCVSKFGRSENI